MEVDNEYERLSVSKAWRLLQFSQNSDEVAPMHEISCMFNIGKKGRFEASALRNNKTIELFKMNFFLNDAIPEKALDDICHFVANNPSLKVLAIEAEEEGLPLSQKTSIHKLLKASIQNKSIENLADRSSQSMLVSKRMSEFVGNYENLQELSINSVTQELVADWPSAHSIKFLNIQSGEEATSNPYIAPFLEKLASSESSSVIRDFFIEMLWSPALVKFLASPYSRVQELLVVGVDLSSPEIMKQFLIGLKGSPTTKILVLNGAADSRSLEVLHQDLKLGMLPVTDLTFEITDTHNFRKNEFAKFLTCGCLEGFGLSCKDQSQHLLAEFGADCTVSILSVDNLSGLFPGLTTALSSGPLVTLKLDRADLSIEDTSNAMFRLLTDDRCHLESLHLNNCVLNATDETFFAKLVESLEGSVSLQTFHFEGSIQSRRLLMKHMMVRISQIKSLRVLEVISSYNVTAAKVSSDFTDVLLQNWSLEKLTFSFSEWYIPRTRKPISIIGHSQQQSIDAVMERNKWRRLIFESVKSSDTAVVEKCFSSMNQVLSLPDGLSLIFWMLEKNPYLFRERTQHSISRKRSHRSISA